MWFDSDITKKIAIMLSLREAGANNGWQGDRNVDYEYYDQRLEKDPKILARLSPQQIQELGISPNNI